MSALHNSIDILVHYFIKELEHTWRVKFPDCKEFVYKQAVDQIVLLIDLKQAKMKDMMSPQIIKAYQQLLLEVQRFYPEFVHSIFIVNTPIFFENIWEAQLSKSIAKDTKLKVRISATSSHADLRENFDEYELPQIYGGVCECRASCVYSEKGPWTEVENQVNYKMPQDDSSDEY